MKSIWKDKTYQVDSDSYRKAFAVANPKANSNGFQIPKLSLFGLSLPQTLPKSEKAHRSISPEKPL